VRLTMLSALVLSCYAGASPSLADDKSECAATVKEDAAIAACTRILQSDPSATYALGNRGISYRIAGEYDKAIADFDQMLAINPANVPALLERGLTYEARGDSERAIADLGVVIGATVTSVPAHFARAMAYQTLGKSDLAEADLNTAINLDRSFTAALYRERGFRLTRDRRYSEAISAFNKAIEIVPDWVGNYFGRASAYTGKGDPQLAARDYQKCLEIKSLSDADHRMHDMARRELRRLSSR